jgi:preprotein translocase subunit SecD
MKQSLYWKLLLILAVIGLSIFFSYPLDQKINLGLDLQGGMHLLLEVETEKAVESTLERYSQEVKDLLKEKGVPVLEAVRTGDNGLSVLLESGENTDPARKAVTDNFDLVEESVQGNRMVFTLSDRRVRYILENAVDQGLETLRNRIDQFGVAEPTIIREGARRILIQLPGLKDEERAKDLIGRTAQLEFKLVNDEGDLSAALRGNIPPGSEILYQRGVDRKTGEEARLPFLLYQRVLLTGDSLTNAEVRIDPQFNEPYVSLEFNREGGRQFARITEQNVKKRLAIVLDNWVYSAPVIQERIPGGQAQITGSFTPEEAHDLAIVLRAGALPAPVHVLEERTVGPSLGKDSIEAGIRSILVGFVLVLVFMAVYYKASGLIAIFALFLNVVIMAGALGYFGATLTLPGIAGIILTIGMALDANVLVFERIREELRNGKTVRAAVDSGFRKAFLTILDSNITTLIAALVLFQFGTGPVKGFAVTLSLGILASMFTAVFVSRFIFDSVLTRRQVRSLSI